MADILFCPKNIQDTIMGNRNFYKLFILNLLILFKVSLFAQDTIKLSKELLDLDFKDVYGISSIGPFFLNGDTIDLLTFQYIKNMKDSIRPIFRNSIGRYCKFYSKDNSLLEEGIWYPEFFAGNYKSYFSNGKIKVEGAFTNNISKIKNGRGGIKIGNWKYYTNKGELYLERNYSPNGKLISSKKYKIDNKFKLNIVRNMLNYSCSIFLYKNEILVDSMSLRNLDFITDSLVNYDNNWWHYYFSTCKICSSKILENTQQILLTVKEDKIHIAFVSDYIHALNFSETIDSIKAEKDTLFYDIKLKYDLYNYIKLDSNFFKSKHLANEIFYCRNCTDNKKENEGMVRQLMLKFDNINKIFYSKKIFLNGAYVFEAEVDGVKTKSVLKNKEAYVLDFYWTPITYFSGKWYFRHGKIFRPIDIIFNRCRGRC